MESPVSITAARVALIIIALAIIVWPTAVLWGVMGRHHHPWILTAIVLGYTAFGLLCLQLVLAARPAYLDRLYGSDRLLMVHRIVGPLLLATVAAHAIGAPFAFSPFTRRLQFMVPPLLETLPGAVAALAVFLAGAVTVVRAVIGIRYDVWRRIHLFGALALPFAMAHAAVAGESFGGLAAMRAYVLVLGTWAILSLLGRAIRRITADRKTVPVLDIGSPAYRTTTVRVARPPGFTFAPGQYCELRVGTDPPHPFTIASSPESPELEFAVREIGDFTTKIRSLAGAPNAHDSHSAGSLESHLTSPTPPTRTDDSLSASVVGPLGRFTPHAAADARTFIFVAGGIGITPFASMLRSERFWANSKLQNVILLWSIRRSSEAPYLNELIELADARPALKLICVHTGERHEEAGSAKRIDESFFAEHCPVQDRNAAWFLCGPNEMIHDCTRALRRLGVRRRRIHSERFRR